MWLIVTSLIVLIKPVFITGELCFFSGFFRFFSTKNNIQKVSNI